MRESFLAASSNCCTLALPTAIIGNECAEGEQLYILAKRKGLVARLVETCCAIHFATCTPAAYPRLVHLYDWKMHSIMPFLQITKAMD